MNKAYIFWNFVWAFILTRTLTYEYLAAYALIEESKILQHKNSPFLKKRNCKLLASPKDQETSRQSSTIWGGISFGSLYKGIHKRYTCLLPSLLFINYIHYRFTAKNKKLCMYLFRRGMENDLLFESVNLNYYSELQQRHCRAIWKQLQLGSWKSELKMNDRDNKEKHKWRNDY